MFLPQKRSIFNCLLTILLLWLVCSCSHKTKKEYYENGNIAFEIHLKDSTLDGDFKHYYRNGNLAYHVIYKNGGLYNIIEVNDTIGRKLDKGNFKNGNGWAKKYEFYSGIKLEEGVFKNGERQGYWYIYNKDDIKDSILFLDGLWNGKEQEMMPY